MNPRRLTRLEVRIARHAGDEALSAILELAHATITDPDFAGVERVETREPPPPRRLAAARRSEQHQALAGLDVERDAVHGVGAPNRFVTRSKRTRINRRSILRDYDRF